jgi:hypothetical protein
MASQNPVYCNECKFLAVARVNDVTYCANCLEKKLETNSVEKIKQMSSPLCFVQNPEMDPPDQEKLKY